MLFLSCKTKNPYPVKKSAEYRKYSIKLDMVGYSANCVYSSDELYHKNFYLQRNADMPHASLHDIFVYDKVKSRISLRSDISRRKANITEKSTCGCKCFFNGWE